MDDVDGTAVTEPRQWTDAVVRIMDWGPGWLQAGMLLVAWIPGLFAAGAAVSGRPFFDGVWGFFGAATGSGVGSYYRARSFWRLPIQRRQQVREVERSGVRSGTVEVDKVATDRVRGRGVAPRAGVTTNVILIGGLLAFPVVAALRTDWWWLAVLVPDIGIAAWLAVQIPLTLRARSTVMKLVDQT